VYLATQCVVLESKADMQKRGQASPDGGDALALTFAQPVAPAEVEEPDEEEEFGSYGGIPVQAAAGGCDNATWQRSRRLLGVFQTPRGRPGRGGLDGERAASGLPWCRDSCNWAS
jgi:hypothetical protein